MILNNPIAQPPAPRTLALPIHPAVTLRDWAVYAHSMIIDSELSDEQAAALLSQIDQDPDARRYFARACLDEALIATCFAGLQTPQAQSAEPVAALESPIW